MTLCRRHSAFRGDRDFYLAHEMAHWILGHVAGPSVTVSEQQQREIDADVRAVEILMRSKKMTQTCVCRSLRAADGEQANTRGQDRAAQATLIPAGRCRRCSAPIQPSKHSRIASSRTLRPGYAAHEPLPRSM